MLQLIAHLFGDFVFQNDWMAINKNQYTLKGWIACFAHCFVYTIFFLFITTSADKLLLVFVSHFVIDKFSLARHWTNFFKVGARMPKDFWLYTYLIFMVDMTFHLLCNFIILR